MLQIYPKFVLALCFVVMVTSPCYGENRTVSLDIEPIRFKDYVNPLVATCTASTDITNERLFMLSLQKEVKSHSADKTYEKVAWISGYDGNLHSNRTVSGEAVTIDGQADLMSGQKPYNGKLTVTWSHPNFTQTGTYVCEAEFFNILTGARLLENQSVTIRNDHPELGDALSKLQDLEDRLVRMEKKQQVQSDSMESFRKSVQLYNFSVSTTSTSTTTYLLTRPLLRNSVFAEALCVILGAKLVELNDELEFTKVTDKLTNFNRTANYMDILHPILTGLTDEIKEGFWHFRSHPNDNSTMAYNGNWLNSTKTKTQGQGNDCVVLVQDNNWKMDDVPCYDNQPYVHFLCEQD